MDHHIVPIRTYLLVFVALIVLLALTVAAAGIENALINNIVAITIAVTKTLLIIFIFMHVKYSSRMTQILAFVGFVWLGILLVFLASDFGSRDWPVVGGSAADTAALVAPGPGERGGSN